MSRQNKNKKHNTEEKQNYLDLIPLHNDQYEWSIDDKQQVIIFRPNVKRMEKFTQKFFHTPKVTAIRLEEFGDFIWPLMDGTRTVYEIAQLVDGQFGEKAAPLYDRLIKYLENMKYHKLIYFKS